MNILVAFIIIGLGVYSSILTYKVINLNKENKNLMNVLKSDRYLMKAAREQIERDGKILNSLINEKYPQNTKCNFIKED